MPSARSKGLIVMFFKESLSICVPMQNKPAKRNVLLSIFKKYRTSSDGLRVVFKATARTKKMIKIGNAPCSWGVEFADDPRNPNWLS